MRRGFESLQPHFYKLLFKSNKENKEKPENKGIRRLCSGVSPTVKMCASHARDPGSTPGRRKFLLFTDSFFSFFSSPSPTFLKDFSAFYNHMNNFQHRRPPSYMQFSSRFFFIFDFWKKKRRKGRTILTFCGIFFNGVFSTNINFWVTKLLMW